MFHACIMFYYTDRAPGGVAVKNIQAHTVQVSWEKVQDADNYNVILTQILGDNQLGLCSESHTVLVDTSSLTIVVGLIANNMLRAYTTYSITVVAMSYVWGRSGDSKPIIVTTNQKSEDCYSTVLSLISTLLPSLPSSLPPSLLPSLPPSLLPLFLRPPHSLPSPSLTSSQKWMQRMKN